VLKKSLLKEKNLKVKREKVVIPEIENSKYMLSLPSRSKRSKI